MQSCSGTRKHFDVSTRKPKQEPSLRGWVRGSPGYPVETQLEALATAGVKTKMIYGAAKGETVGDMIDGLAAGDVLVVHGTHRLGATLAQYAAVLDQLRRKRITIKDTEFGAEITGRELVAASMVARDRSILLGEARIDAAGLRKRIPGRMKREDAEAVWRDMSVPTDSEAARRARWGRRTMYETFGKSGRPQGRKAATKD